jgi:hypothetical protein
MRDYLLERLKKIPLELEKVEKDYYDSVHKLKTANFKLTSLENKLLLAGAKNEKSERLREAAMHSETNELKKGILELEKEIDSKKVIYHRIKREADNLQYLTRLIT